MLIGAESTLSRGVLAAACVPGTDSRFPRACAPANAEREEEAGPFPLRLPQLVVAERGVPYGLPAVAEKAAAVSLERPPARGILGVVGDCRTLPCAGWLDVFSATLADGISLLAAAAVGSRPRPSQYHAGSKVKAPVGRARGRSAV